MNWTDHLLKSVPTRELVHRQWLGVGFPAADARTVRHHVTGFGMEETATMN